MTISNWRISGDAASHPVFARRERAAGNVKAMPREDRLLLTVVETARLLSLNRGAVYGLIQAGQIPVFRIGQRKTRVARADLERVISERKLGTYYGW